jgi:glutathione synthase/RimK-type ligase-like ATP-grasp enzyme
MKKIMIVGGTSSNNDDRKALETFYTYVRDVYTEAQYSLTYLDDLCYTIAPGIFKIYDTRNHMKLDDVDIVFFRAMMNTPIKKGYYLSRYCNLTGKPCVTDYSRCFPANKVGEAILFFDHDVPFLCTSYCPNNTLLIKHAESTYGYPYILKAITASHGDSNYLVKSREEAEQIILKEPDIEFLAQEYCPNNHDYRLLLAGDEYLLFERRGSADSHLNNTSKGATARKVSDILPAEIIKQSRHLASSLGVMLAGVDIIQNIETDKLYFLEVNLQPQLRTGAFLDDKKELIRKLLDRL